ncbi:Leucine-rich repeat serine/threonine-protein kinase 2 [Tulasnella sp. 424]|nr:Leucine-rich repeat serine/threonine-protein kinase 2 [Tulasnella sp. 424]
MVSQRSDTALMPSTTAAKEGSQTARFSSTLQLTAEEKEIEEYLDQRLNKPRGSFFDTVIERMERFEPLARSIEELLARNDFKEHVDEAMEANARQMVEQFRARKAQVRSGIFGRIPMFAVLSAVDEFGTDLQTGYLDLKIRISTQWKAKKLAEAYMRELKVPKTELKQQKEEVVRATTELSSAYKGVHTQILFGQYVCQNRDENGLLLAELDDNPICPIIYIDFSGDQEGKQVQGSYGSIHHAWTSPDRSESSGMFAVKVPRDHRTGQNAEQIAGAVSYMHDRIVVHGDVKLANVILSRNPLKPLLCDFGFSLRRHLDSTRDSVKKVGSGPYLSPEAYRGTRKTFASDTWSFGICIMHALMKNLPFGDRVKDAEDIHREYNNLFVAQNLRPTMPPGLTSAGVLAWSVALACTNNTESDRPEMKEVHLAMQDIVAGREGMVIGWLDRWKERRLCGAGANGQA